MILTEFVMYRGKQRSVDSLSDNNGYKVDVQCPMCMEIRNVYHRSIIKSGHHVCQKCMVNKVSSKKLNIGDRYNKLTVIQHSKRTGFSICRCDCGTIKEVGNYELKSGGTKSCGCLIKENRLSIIQRGENHWNWKGGVSDIRERHMQTSEYKEWRKAIFERDDYICQCCGKRGYELNAHHINSYSQNEDLRLDVDNGITFCRDCHIEFHKKYGRKNINKTDIDDYIIKFKEY